MSGSDGGVIVVLIVITAIVVEAVIVVRQRQWKPLHHDGNDRQGGKGDERCEGRDGGRRW